MLSIVSQATAADGFRFASSDICWPSTADTETGLLPARDSAEADKHRPYGYGFRVLERYPHDTTAFTQGLTLYQGRLFESTGQWGSSSLRELALQRGTVIRQALLSPYHFGEGLTAANGRLVQLTWKSGEGLIYDPDTLETVGRFHYPGEGWGIAAVGRQLVASDGTAQLRFLDPETFAELRRVTVKQGTISISGLNELEFAEGSIFANVWPGDCIAEIDPTSGRVLGWLNLTGLLPQRDKMSAQSVLNGIAYDADTKSWLVTGKNWPYLFRIAIQRTSPP